MHEWDTFAVVLGGSAGALVGLLFVALSIHASRIANSADLLGRAAQTMLIFAALLLTSLLMSVPGQLDRVLGVELIALALLIGAFLILLERLAKTVESQQSLARMLDRVNPSLVTAGGVGLTGVLLVCGVGWAHLVLVPAACVAIIGGLASAFLLLTKLSD
jgi:Ca2+/Na+ antiporter